MNDFLTSRHKITSWVEIPLKSIGLKYPDENWIVHDPEATNDHRHIAL